MLRTHKRGGRPPTSFLSVSYLDLLFHRRGILMFLYPFGLSWL
jgi:hypothetical protein